MLSMRLPFHLEASPQRLLLLLEWLLLALVFLGQIFVTLNQFNLEMLIGNSIGLIVFSGLGFVLPTRRSHKLLYTFVEFSLILFFVFIGEISLFSLLYIVLVIRNCFLLEGYDRLVITAITFIQYVLCHAYRVLYGLFPLSVPAEKAGLLWVGPILTVGMVMLFLQLLVDAVMTEQKSRQNLAIAHARLRQYALRVEELATVQERNRIARDIHDSLGHSLTVFNLHLEAARRLLHTDPAEVEALLSEAKELSTKALKDVRESVTTLRADPLQGRSLQDGISCLMADFFRATNVNPHYKIDIPTPLPNELNITIFRIVQEGLTNISKHAKASSVEINLKATDTGVQVTICDNGQGFEWDNNTTGFGLQGMRERVQAIAGQFTVMTAPSQGCKITALLPRESSIWDNAP